ANPGTHNHRRMLGRALILHRVQIVSPWGCGSGVGATPSLRAVAACPGTTVVDEVGACASRDGLSEGLILSHPSLRAQRSNPESFRGDSLDCFAALAMTAGQYLA